MGLISQKYNLVWIWSSQGSTKSWWDPQFGLKWRSYKKYGHKWKYVEGFPISYDINKMKRSVNFTFAL